MTDVGDGADWIVGNAVDDQCDAAGTVAFVAQFAHVIGALGTGAALDGALDGVLGHVGRQRLVDGGTQARIASRVGHAGACRDSDFTDQLGEGLGALGVLGVFATFDAWTSTHRYS